MELEHLNLLSAFEDPPRNLSQRWGGYFHAGNSNPVLGPGFGFEGCSACYGCAGVSLVPTIAPLECLALCSQSGPLEGAFLLCTPVLPGGNLPGKVFNFFVLP